MTVRGAQGGVGSSGSTDAGERRQGAGRRIHFEALVAIGESGGAGFDAESVDVSPDGMRLRTAYLPEVGERLVCRFEAERGEVVVDGEVAWVNAEARGGEFGLRFDALDEATTASLRALCVPLELEPAAGAADRTIVRGTRMRLHIEGLAAPMKARVRESADGEIKVGSNLEFLKVGRTIELEDVDHGARREAFVDHVKVEIDPASSVPQLVVSLRYESKRSPAAVAAPAESAVPAAPKTERTPGPAVLAPRKGAVPVIDEDPEQGDDPLDVALDAGSASTSGADAPAPPRPDRKRVAAAAADADAVDGEKFLGTGAKAARAGMAMADKIVPAMKVAGAKAKTAMTRLLATVQKKRAERAESKKATAPMRMTAPAPKGALKTEGRRLVRDDGSDDDEAPAPEAKPKMNRKAAAIGGALGLVAVLGVFAATRGPSRPAEHVASAASADAVAAPTSLAATAPMAAEPPAGGAMTAQVPLFGATPMSTTEAVPTAPGSGSPAPGLPTQPDAVAAAGDGEEPGGDDGEPGGAAKATGVKEWGHGSVKKPVVLRIKMDGPVEGLNGASGAMGFTISLPGRRSLSSAAELARKDKRIASIHVENRPNGADVSIQFKDGVPPYLAKAKGDVLEIDLGADREHGKKVASKGGKKGDDKPSKKKKGKKK